MDSFHVPLTSMTVFDIVSISLFIVSYNKFIAPLYTKITKIKPKRPIEFQRVRIGLVIAIVALAATTMVEVKRLKYAKAGNGLLSSLSIFWQVPQYVLKEISEAFMYVGQMEFFSSQTPDANMPSLSTGSYLCSLDSDYEGDDERRSTRLDTSIYVCTIAKSKHSSSFRDDGRSVKEPVEARNGILPARNDGEG